MQVFQKMSILKSTYFVNCIFMWKVSINKIVKKDSRKNNHNLIYYPS